MGTENFFASKIPTYGVTRIFLTRPNARYKSSENFLLLKITLENFQNKKFLPFDSICTADVPPMYRAFRWSEK